MSKFTDEIMNYDPQSNLTVQEITQLAIVEQLKRIADALENKAHPLPKGHCHSCDEAGIDLANIGGV